MRFYCLLCVICVLVPPAMSADRSAGALSAWQRGDRAEAIALWVDLADRGDAQANLVLGHVYRRGLGVDRDAPRAAARYRRAAELGDAEAQYELGLMYELGIGVTADPGEAGRWYAMSAAQHCPGELGGVERLLH